MLEREVIIEEGDLKEGELPLNSIIHGNTLTVLKKLPSESVDCVVTSPPYWGLRDYGEGANTVWGGDPDCEHEWVIETTKHDNLRPSKVSERTIVGSNKELRFRTGEKVRSAFCVRCNAWYGQLGLEPSLDMYIEHLLEIMRELKRVLKKTGIIFWNHGDCYGGNMGFTSSTKSDAPCNQGRWQPEQPIKRRFAPKCMALQNFRFIIRCVDELGLILRNVIIWHKPNHMPSSVKDRFTSAYEPVFMLVKSKKYWFDLDAVRVPHGSFENCRLKHRRHDCASEQYSKHTHGPDDYHPLGKNPGDVWAIPTQPFPEAHFAVYPEKLVEPMIKAACPQEICKKCGKPRERIVAKKYIQFERPTQRKYIQMVEHSSTSILKTRALPLTYIEGWTDCGCNAGWDGA